MACCDGVRGDLGPIASVTLPDALSHTTKVDSPPRTPSWPTTKTARLPSGEAAPLLTEGFPSTAEPRLGLGTSSNALPFLQNIPSRARIHFALGPSARGVLVPENEFSTRSSTEGAASDPTGRRRPSFELQSQSAVGATITPFEGSTLSKSVCPLLGSKTKVRGPKGEEPRVSLVPEVGLETMTPPMRAPPRSRSSGPRRILSAAVRLEEPPETTIDARTMSDPRDARMGDGFALLAAAPDTCVPSSDFGTSRNLGSRATTVPFATS